MSHSSGIPVSEALKQSFGEARTSNSKRLLKVQIENDVMVEVGSRPPRGDWEADLSYMQEVLDADQASYILFKTADEWVLFCYVPDKCKVKEKMLYASSRANLKTQLGSNYIGDDIFGTVPADFNKEGYRQHVHSKKAEAPLTAREVQKKNELESGEVYSSGTSTYVHGVAFPIDKAVSQAAKDFVAQKIHYFRVGIDIEGEKVVLDKTAGNLNFGDLKSGQVSGTEPRFHFFRYRHEFEGLPTDSVLFIYTCPDGSDGTKPAPIKMRMLYSSSKANVSEIIAAEGGKIDARFEASSGNELDEEEVQDTLHPKKEEKTKGFSRPKKPGKGPNRLTRDGQKQN